MQLSCSIAVIVLFTWGKDPSSAFSFDNLVLEDAGGPLDFRPHWYFFASVGLFTSAYALLLPAAGFVGLNVWPSAVSASVCVCVPVQFIRNREAVTATPPLPPAYLSFCHLCPSLAGGGTSDECCYHHHGGLTLRQPEPGGFSHAQGGHSEDRPHRMTLHQ